MYLVDLENLPHIIAGSCIAQGLEKGGHSYKISRLPSRSLLRQLFHAQFLCKYPRK